MAFDGSCIDNQISNNIFHTGCGISAALPNSTYINNTIYDNGVFNVGVGRLAVNNTQI